MVLITVLYGIDIVYNSCGNCMAWCWVKCEGYEGYGC